MSTFFTTTWLSNMARRGVTGLVYLLLVLIFLGQAFAGLTTTSLISRSLLAHSHPPKESEEPEPPLEERAHEINWSTVQARRWFRRATSDALMIVSQSGQPFCVPCAHPSTRLSGFGPSTPTVPIPLRC